MFPHFSTHSNVLDNALSRSQRSSMLLKHFIDLNTVQRFSKKSVLPMLAPSVILRKCGDHGRKKKSSPIIAVRAYRSCTHQLSGYQTKGRRSPISAVRSFQSRTQQHSNRGEHLRKEMRTRTSAVCAASISPSQAPGGSSCMGRGQGGTSLCITAGDVAEQHATRVQGV